SRGNKPDLMIRMFVHKKWEEIEYLESGKWNCNDEKIRDDHNKLVQFCLDGTEELFKICKKGSLNKNYIGFGVNIADESVDEVEEFVHALLILRNGMIVNAQEQKDKVKAITNVSQSSNDTPISDISENASARMCRLTPNSD
ncbi:3153_t:CDS:2, partial [Racocetra persica]